MNKNSEYVKKFTLAPLLIMAAVILFSMLGFICGRAISPLCMIIPVFLLLTITFFTDRQLCLSVAVCFAALALWAIVCGFMFDYSYDGMYYHKQAAITLKEGWNPIFESSASRDVFANYLDLSLWLDNYPKGLWSFSAAIYSITNRIETAKAVNLLPLISVFAASFDVLGNVFDIHGLKRGILSALFVLNPVFVCQIFTFYNDLSVGSMIILAALIGIKIYKEKADKTDYTALFLIMSLSCVVKFTAPMFVGLTLLAFGICCFVKWRDKRILKPAAVVIAGCVFGVAVLGAQPYITHIADGQNIIYPVLGEGKYDIMNTNPPSGFESRPAVANLAVSLFSKANNVKEDGSQLKIPFSVHKDEFLHMSNADVRVSGFGPWFSGVIILSLAALIALILRRKRPEAALIIPLVTFTLFALCFSEAWWARYASFIYYIPIFLLTALLCGDGKDKAIKGLAYVQSAALLVNVAIIICAVFVNGTQMNSLINTRLDEIAKQDKKIVIRVNDFTSHVKLFSERGIDFEVSHKALENPEIFYLTTKYKYVD